MADEQSNHQTKRACVNGTNILPWVERWLSPERLAPYLEASECDAEKALELYRWNVALGQFLMRDISYFEVALRNAYNDTMEARWDGERHWLLDGDSPVRRPVMRKSGKGTVDVNRINRKIIDVAVSGLPEGFSSGDLVSNLTLGFWVHLTDRSREAVIWRTGLYAAWPKGTGRVALQNRLDGILRVRNRIAHNERLFNPKCEQLSPMRVSADALALLGQLCPEAAAYVRGSDKETIEDFLARNPAPVNVRL